jgi:hypothetical protein
MIASFPGHFLCRVWALLLVAELQVPFSCCLPPSLEVLAYLLVNLFPAWTSQWFLVAFQLGTQTVTKGDWHSIIKIILTLMWVYYLEVQVIFQCVCTCGNMGGKVKQVWSYRSLSDYNMVKDFSHWTDCCIESDSLEGHPNFLNKMPIWNKKMIISQLSCRLKFYCVS